MFLRVLLLAALLAESAQTIAADAPFDLIIRNGRIIDGTGSPWYSGDIGIRAGRIAAIGHLSARQARRVIDAGGLIVAPGFIDMLGQSELSILVDPRLPSKIYQGITTEITGEGDSVAPLSDSLVKDNLALYQEFHLTAEWRSLSDYFARLETQGIGVNFATFVGATQVRRLILGDADRTPSAEQLNQMKNVVRSAMQDGAQGVSTSLEYAPALYAKTDELIALASVAAAYGGIYATHIRTEGEGMLAALDEAFQIGRAASIPVEIYHIKAEGKPSFGKMPEIVAKIDAARAAGLDISADTYAYPAWGNPLSAAMPPWVQDGGTAAMLKRLTDPEMRARVRRDLTTPTTQWENEWLEVGGPEDFLIVAVHNPALKALQGKTLAKIAAIWQEDPIDAVMDLLIKDSGSTGVVVFAIAEPDIELALAQPWVSVGCDEYGASPQGPLSQIPVHPRGYGTFPRILRKFVREKPLLSLADAIRKFSALPAQRMHLIDRGVLKEGMWADIVVFDPQTITDLATFEKPHQLSQGMRYVLVNGIPVIDHARATNALPGKVLRGPGFSAAPQP